MNTHTHYDYSSRMDREEGYGEPAGSGELHLGHDSRAQYEPQVTSSYTVRADLLWPCSFCSIRIQHT